jgi:hypothetical protein
MAEEETDYFPTDEAGIRQLLLSLKTKAPTYKVLLELTDAKLQEFSDRSDLYEFLIDYSELLDNTKVGFNTAKDIIVNGDPKASIPVLPSLTVPAPPVDLLVGIIKLTRKDIAKMKLASGYSPEIGEDIGFIKQKAAPASPDTFVPTLELLALIAYHIQVTFKRRGMSGLRIEFRRKGGEWQRAETAFASPFTFAISPATLGDAEQIEIRAIYMKGNETFGQYSPSYTISIAP